MSSMEGYALSPQQKAAWLDIREGYTGKMEIICKVGKDLDWDRLRKAVAIVLDENPLFRLSFLSSPGSPEPLQVSTDQHSVQFELLRRDPDQLVLAASPLCADLWTMYLLAAAIFRSYDNKEPLPTPPIDYLQFSEWQNQLLETPEIAEGKAYWQQRLLARHTLPDLLFGKRHQLPQPEIASFTTRLDESLSARARESLLAAAWYLVLWKLNRQSDFLLGHVHHGRSYEQLHQVMGTFARLLPVQLDIDPHAPISTVVQQYENEIELADTHKEAFPVDEQAHRFIKTELAYRFQYTDFDLLDLDPLPAPVMLWQPDRPLRIHLQVDKIQGTPFVHFYYDRLSYTTSDIDYLFHAWQTVLQQMLDHAVDVPAGSIQLMSDEQALSSFGVSDKVPLPDITITTLFRQAMSIDPDKPAVVDEDKALSYRELDEQSSLLAKYLLDNGALSGQTRIGILQREKRELILSMMAVLKAGGTYVPIDPNDSIKRMQHIISDSGIRCILTATGLHAGIEDDQIDFIEVDSLILSQSAPVNPVTAIHTASIILPERSPSTPAYVIYTSGTSGLPKGVAIQDISLVNYITWLQRFAGITDKDSSMLLSSYAFDLGYTALWGTLLSGGTLHLLPREKVQDMDALVDYIVTRQISFLKTTPSFFNVFIHSSQAARLNAASLRLMILGGEFINVDDLSLLHTQINPDMAVINHYGPTETTIGTIAHKIDMEALSDYKQHPVIGRPISNNFVYMLDDKGRLTAPGIVGEICIGGKGLSAGYLNLPDLTLTKFTIYPATGQRIYHTGDMGTWMPEGSILYLGRIDDQVKIRGYRVEPGEVKQAISQYPGIDQVVITVNGEGFDKQLVAYITGNDILDLDRIKVFLRSAIPDYMIPAHLIQLKEIPLTPNHKIDYKALPAPGTTVMVKKAATPPGNNREAQILKVWCQVLGNDQIGIDDDFFELGGHSLKAIQVVNRLQKELKIKASIKDIFNSPTVHSFALATQGAGEQNFQFIEAAPEKPYYALSNAQRRIWFISQRKGAGSVYNVPQYCLFNGPLDIALLEQAFLQLIARHESLRTVFRVVEGEPVQFILPATDIPFFLRQVSATGKEEVETIISGETIKPFGLEREIAIRATLITLGHEQYLLLFTLHHIISDGWSREIIYQELIQLYEANYYSRPGTLSPLRIQYKDYVNWHNGIYKDQEEFWARFFQTGIPSAHFPLDHPRPKQQRFQGDIHTCRIGGEGLAALKQIVNSNKLTLNSLLIGAYGLLLGEYAMTSQVMVGTLVSGRNHLDLEGIVGVFINYLPFRMDIDKTAGFIPYFASVNQSLLNTYQHQDYPFDSMVEKFAGHAEPGRNPIFDTMMIFHEEENKAVYRELPGNVSTSEYEDNNRQYLSKLDFKIDVTTTETSVFLRLEYNRSLFDPETMQSFLNRYVALLAEIADSPHLILDHSPVLSATHDALIAAARDRQLKVAGHELKIIASFTADPLEEQLRWWLDTFDQQAAISLSPYHQVFQELLSLDQPASSAQGRICILLNRFEDYAVTTLDGVCDRLLRTLPALAASTPVIMVITSPEDTHPAAAHIRRLNEACCQTLAQEPNIYLIDLRDYPHQHPGSTLFDPVSYAQAYIPFTMEGFYMIAYHIMRTYWALKGPSCKVIALDCDNTLWEGVCGEDALSDIHVNAGHLALQAYCIRKYEEGFLLVLLSKNNEEDVWTVFDKHPDMLLKKEHIVGSRINWEDKSQNIVSLAQELNLGLDSFAFIDDNPVECYHMMEQHPEVLTLELPRHHAHFRHFLDQVIAFDKLRVSKEDATRNQMYKAEIRRSQSLRETELSSFLDDLQLQMSFRLMAADELERVAQLTQRTNQFNLNGIRRSKQEITRLLENDAFQCYVIHVRDRFGAYGLVGVIILEQREDCIFLHNYLLSCRVLGRGIEQAILNVLQKLANDRGINRLTAAFRQTEKNKPFSDFLAQAHWTQSANTSAGETLLHLTTDAIPPASGVVDVYIDADLPVVGDETPDHSIAIDLLFDHIGIAVSSIAETRDRFRSWGFEWGKEVFDPLQSCMLTMGHRPDYYQVELIAGVGADSPVTHILQGQSARPYHICFRVKDFQQTLDHLRDGGLEFDMIKSPQPAVLFDNLKVLFIYLEHIGLVELIEDPGLDKLDRPSYDVKPVLLLFSEQVEEAIRISRLLGFDRQFLHLEILPGQTGELLMDFDTRIFTGIAPVDDLTLFAHLDKDDEEPVWVWEKNLRNEDRLLHRQVYKALEYGNPQHWARMEKEQLTLLTEDREGEAPADEMTHTLMGLFKEVLKTGRLGIYDDFFQSGGHSIKAVQLLSKIYQTFKVNISLAAFFDMNTVAATAEEIIRQRSEEGIGQEASIPTIPVRSMYPLSASQQRLWLLCQFEGSSTAYNIPGVVVFEGTLDREALSAAFAMVIRRHEILRTIFRVDEEGTIEQQVLDAEALGFAINYRDLRTATALPTLPSIIAADFHRTFDLSAGPLLRASLYQLSDTQWIFSYVMHHIISDAWSLGVFFKDLLKAYNGLVSGGSQEQAPLRIQYKDYAVWQRSQAEGTDAMAHKAYWLDQFRGELPVLELPVDRARPAVKTYNGGLIKQTFSPELTQQLHTILRGENCTLFMGLLSAVNVLLYRYTGQQDIVIGSPVAGRDHSDLGQQIGLYVNTIALRSRFSGLDSFRQLLQLTRSITLGAYAHQSYPFDALVTDLSIQHDPGRSPLFDVMVALQNAGDEDLSLPAGLKVAPYGPIDHISSKFELLFNFHASDGTIHMAIEYNSDLFEQSTILRIAGHLERLLEAIAAGLDKPVNQLSYLSKAEKDQLLEQFNATEDPDYPADKTIVTLFQEQVLRSPDAVAVAFERQELTYQELNVRANQLAHYLINRGVRPDSLVPICLERSLDMIIAIMGILKAGAAYVPIDPEYPAERITHLISDTGAGFLIGKKNISQDIPVIDLSDTGILMDQPADDPRITIQPTDLAYVIYTSGSTGQPKGVLNEHRGLVNRLWWAQQYFQLTSGDTVLQKTTYSFDVSVWELIWPLIAGAKLVFARPGGHRDNDYLKAVIHDRSITMLHFVPSMLSVFLDSIIPGECTGLRKVLCSGEALTPAQVALFRQKLPSAALHNLYGPTEAAIDVTHYPIGQPVLPIVPIGRPIANTSMYILDPIGNMVPVGVPGELYIGGIQVARGYLNRPELTAERFPNDPFGKTDGKTDRSTLYKTGDLGRWLPDGNIEYLGRMDFQVKVRGYRIELGEIENTLERHDQIRQAVVLARPTMELIAYIICDTPIPVSELREWLSDRLPGYMVPAYFKRLDTFPLTSNGKIDRKKLRSYEADELSSGVTYIAPANAYEQTLTAIFAEGLDLLAEKIGVRDNFFALGGDSIKAMRIIVKINKAFHTGLTVPILYDHQTIGGLSGWLQAHQPADTRPRPIGTRPQPSLTQSFPPAPGIPLAPPGKSYALSSAQQRLYFLSRLDGGEAYHISRIWLLEGKLDRSLLNEAFNALIERHDILRTVFREEEDGNIMQYILPATERSIAFHDLRNTNGQAGHPEEAIRSTIHRRFDLARGPLLHAALFQIDEDQWIFLYVLHHIITDGWSMEIFIRELSTLYKTFSKKEPAVLLPLRIQYKDYAAWQQTELANGQMQEHARYWLSRFHGKLPVLLLPTDLPRPAIKTYNGALFQQAIDKELTTRLKHFTREQEGTLFITLMTAIYTLLANYTGQEDIILGTSIAGRDQVDLEDQIGLYVNTIALRMKLTGSMTFQELFERVRQVVFEGYAHQQYPLDELVLALNGKRDPSRNQLFDVTVVLQNTIGESGIPQMDELKISRYKANSRRSSQFDLSFDFFDNGDELMLSIEYNTDLFYTETIACMAGHLEQVFSIMTENKAKLIGGTRYRLPVQASKPSKTEIANDLQL